MKASDAPWTSEEDEMLTDMFLAYTPFREIASKLKRTENACYARVRKIGCTRKPRNRFALGNRGRTDSPLRTKISNALQRQDMTMSDLVIATGAKRTSIAKVCIKLRELGKAHILRWERGSHTAWQWAFVMRYGQGDDAAKPYHRSESTANNDILPIPNPTLDFWHQHVFRSLYES